MNKKDIPIIIILILLMVVWMFIDSRFIAPKYNQDNDISESITNSSLEPNNIPVLIKPSSKEVTFEEDNYIEEKIVSLQNDFVKINITSIGGGLKSALLLNYKSTDNSDSDSLLLDFPRLSPLSYSSNMGLNTNSSYKIQKIDSAQVILSRSISKHINLERTFTLGDEYLLSITDRFQNTSSELQELENRIIYTGFMSNPDGTHKMIGESIVGVDSYNTSDGIFYWGKPGYLNKKVFSKKSSVNFIDTIPQEMNNKPVDWISCKNKFFAQILDPKEQASTMRILCYRDDDKNAEMIASGLNLKSNNIRPDSSLSLTYDYYIGPRDYYILKGYNQSYEKIREFETIGFWSGWNVIMEPIRISLNWLLIKINKYIPGGYGIAIILLTILMRLLFHPLHKKSMDSMKNMQEIDLEQ